MRIKQGCKLREIAGENVVVMQGKHGADFTRIITFNQSALVLWKELEGRNFTIAEAVNVLTSNFEVDEATALRDVEQWVERMKECSLIVTE